MWNVVAKDKITYTEELGDSICQLIASGMTLNKICKLDGMPSWYIVRQWRLYIPEFAQKFALANVDKTHLWADEMKDISDEVHLGTVVVETTVGGKPSISTTTCDMINHRKLQIETRKWLIGKINPQHYGEKVYQETVSNVNITTEFNTPKEAAMLYSNIINSTKQVK